MALLILLRFLGVASVWRGVAERGLRVAIAKRKINAVSKLIRTKVMSTAVRARCIQRRESPRMVSTTQENHQNHLLKTLPITYYYCMISNSPEAQSVINRQSIENGCREAKGQIPISEQAVAYDKLDALPTTILPEVVRNAAKETMLEATNALCKSEQERRQALIRLTARTIQQARIQYRYFEALRTKELDAYLAGRSSARRVEILEKIVQQQHRRLFDGLTFMARLDQEQVPSVKVTVDHDSKAAVVFQGER